MIIASLIDVLEPFPDIFEFLYRLAIFIVFVDLFAISVFLAGYLKEGLSIDTREFS